MDPLDLSARIIAGEATVEHPVGLRQPGEVRELAEGVGWSDGFANVAAVRDSGELMLVDVGTELLADPLHDRVREWTGDPLRTVVYTHGHVDHVGGVGPFEAEEGASVQVLAHERVVDRFERYRLTHGYNAVINQRQFRLTAPWFQQDFREPDLTYRDHMETSVGGLEVQLHHDRGETDDHTWVWVPERKALCTGDLFIWVSPNCGNPQKVQRYPMEWAAALRRMAALEPELLLPGHGLPIGGREVVVRVLTTTAEYLESLVEQSLALMNAGARLDTLLHEVSPPAELAELPWLQPHYDEPEFIVRNLWRLYGGWYDGNPSHLHPAPEAALAAEVAGLAGGPGALADRALALVETGDLRLAGHLVEMAALAAPQDPGVHRARAEVNRARLAAATSTMAKGVYAWAQHESEQAAGENP